MTTPPSSARTEAPGRHPAPWHRLVDVPSRGVLSRYVGAGVISGVGLGALVVHAVQGFAELQASALTVVFGRLVPILLSLTLLGASYWLLAGEWDGRHVLRTAGWCVLGVAVLASAGELVVLYQRVIDVALRYRVFVVTNLGLWGAAIGTLVGIYETKLTLNHERATARKDRFEFLNRLLRHEVLNRMNLLLIELDAVDGGSAPEERSRLATAREQGEAVVTLVQRARILTETDRENADGEPVDLSRLLVRVVERARSDFPTASFAADGVPDGLYVEADEILTEVFRNLLENAVRHNDTDSPQVRVSAEVNGQAVRVRVADDGPGVPDGEKGAVFERAAKDPDSPGEGLGLYLADLLVSSYGGSIWVEDGQPRGAVFAVELRAAGQPPPAERRPVESVD